MSYKAVIHRDFLLQTADFLVVRLIIPPIVRPKPKNAIRSTGSAKSTRTILYARMTSKCAGFVQFKLESTLKLKFISTSEPKMSNFEF